MWVGRGAGAIVVCDGCGSGASSEVGARLGARLVIAALASRMASGIGAADAGLWPGVRREVVGVLGRIVEAMRGDRERAIHDHFLFTVVAAAVSEDCVSVWALGDGAYAIGERVRVLGPFTGNQPPYLAYDLLGSPQLAQLETSSGGERSVVVATDGVAEIGLEAIALDRALRHPDALRRQLTVLARSTERIDWAAQRIVRVPAVLQDDGAVAVLRWS